MSYELQATVREAQGTGASRRLRREGQVPAVLYGENQEAVAIALDHKTVFYALEKESFHTSLITHDVIVRDFQVLPFRQQIQHLDLQVVDLNKPLKIRLPIHVVNAEQSKAVKLQSGRVSLLTTGVEVIVDPKNIPAALELDCAQVVAGDILHLSDIQYPEGVSSVALKRNSNLAVATVTGKKG